MNYSTLTWAGISRKPVRSGLMFASMLIAFVLFGLLYGVDTALSQLASNRNLGRAFVEARFGRPLPVSYLSQIERVNGIGVVTQVTFFGGAYRDPKNGMLVIGTDPARWLSIRPEYRIAPEQLDAMTRTRIGALISESLAQKNGWKVGDRFSLASRTMRMDGSTTWPFEVVGILTNPEFSGDNPMMLANYAYVDETRVADRGTAFRFLLRVADPTRTAQIAKKIDALFANSPAPTRTQSEEAAAQAQVARIGDVSFFARSIIGAVFFTLMLLTGNTMMESVRERTAEFAVLRTIGFSPRKLAVLVGAESLLLCIGGAMIGLAVAAAIFPLARQYIGTASLPGRVIVLGMVLATAVGLASATIPATRAARLRIVQALGVR